jgi:hypothetical protein
MKPIISFCVAAFTSLFLLITASSAQNLSITLDPVNPPVQIPAPGGSFSYDLTLHNNGTVPQTFSAWIMARLPDQSWFGPVVGPTTLTLPGGASVSR